MRILGRLLVLLAVLGCIVAIALPAYTSIASHRKVELSNPLLEIASPSVVHRLDNIRWTEFEVAKTTDRLRLLTNANIDAGLSADIETPRHYAIRYQLRSENGDVVLEKVHHMRSKMTLFEEPESKRTFSSSFYLDPETVPLSSRSLRIALAPESAVKSIRARVESKDDTIDSVMLRVYQPEVVHESELAKRWKRLSYRNRTALSEKTVYTQGLLRDAEKKNLIRNRMRPVGPVGIEGQDYEQSLIYVVKEHDGVLIDEPVAANVDLIPAGTRIVLQIPAPGGDIVITATSPDAAVLNADAEWISEKPGAPDAFTMRFDGSAPAHFTRPKPGLLLLRLDQAAVVTASLKQHDVETDISPVPRRLRTWSVAGETPLEYRVDHIQGFTTTMRLDIRALMPEFAGGSIAIEQFNGNGQSLRKDIMSFDAVRSEFDHRPRAPQSPDVSDPVRRYLDVQPNARRIRLTGPAGIVVSAYTRIPDQIQTTRVPADYRIAPTAAERDARVPTWFQIKPMDSGNLTRNDRMVIVSVQRRPPERDPEVLAGHYQWEAFEPDGLWTGRHVFIRREAGPARAEAAGSTYSRLPGGRPVAVDVIANSATARAQPRLIWRHGRKAAFVLRISVDGQALLTEEVFGEFGELRLPPIAAGRHTLEVSGLPENAEIYLSNLSSKSDSGHWLRRLAYRTGDDSLSFVYPKKTNGIEVLTGNLQLPSGAGPAVTALTVRVRAAHQKRGLLPSKTFLTRRFQVTQGISDGGFVIGGGDRRQLREGASFYVPLAEDLPPGDYTIDVSFESNPNGFLSLYRLIPGKYEQRKFFVEMDLQDADAG